MTMNMGANKLAAIISATIAGAAVYGVVRSMCCSKKKKFKKLVRRTGNIMYGAGTVMHHLAKSML